MTVKELIEKLKEYDPNCVVLVKDLADKLDSYPVVQGLSTSDWGDDCALEIELLSYENKK